MVKVCVAGSCGLDDIKTQFGEVKRALGGSGIYASFAASFFSKPGLMSVYGEDFPEEYLALLKEKGIDLAGFRKVEGKNFYWSGEYGEDVNEAKSLDTQLNSLLKFNTTVPEEYKSAEFILLGNFDPEQQLQVLSQFDQPKFVVADTMNYWIQSKRDKVLEVVDKVDITLMNGTEAKMLFNTHSLVDAFEHLLSHNSEFAIIKKGEHGSMMFSKDKKFVAPAYPIAHLKDPTGAGDCFAGALTGYLSQAGEITEKALRKAMIYGSAVASLNVEGFSLNRLKEVKRADIDQRFEELREITLF